MSDTPEKLIGTKEVGRRYGVHEKSIFGFLKEGKIPKPARHPFGRKLMWREEAINEHIRTMQPKEES